jgi:hypothetical protein
MQKQSFTKLAEGRDRQGFTMTPVNEIKDMIARGKVELTQKGFNFGIAAHLYHNREKGDLIFHGAHSTGRFYAVARFTNQ